MTLITLSARVHFADAVLEEALRSELELRRLRRPLIVSEARFEGTALRERVSSSFARRMPVTEHQIAAAGAQVDARAIAQLLAEEHADVLIAYGSAKAIAVVRHSLSLFMQTIMRYGSGGSPRSAPTPHFFAVLGIDGLPDPETALRTPLPRKPFLPDVIVCDPTLTVGTDIRESVSAAVTAFARCMEAYLSSVFNPPADGAALDGFSRVMTSLPRLLKSETLAVRREMMAASLNSTLAQRKGIGTAQSLAAALVESAGKELDRGAVLRLILPGVIRMGAKQGVDRHSPLRRLMALSSGQSLADGAALCLGPAPLPQRLSDMGFSRDDLDAAANGIAPSTQGGRRAGAAAEMVKILDAVF